MQEELEREPRSFWDPSFGSVSTIGSIWQNSLEARRAWATIQLIQQEIQMDNYHRELLARRAESSNAHTTREVATEGNKVLDACAMSRETSVESKMADDPYGAVRIKDWQFDDIGNGEGMVRLPSAEEGKKRQSSPSQSLRDLFTDPSQEEASSAASLRQRRAKEPIRIALPYPRLPFAANPEYWKRHKSSSSLKSTLHSPPPCPPPTTPLPDLPTPQTANSNLNINPVPNTNIPLLTPPLVVDQDPSPPTPASAGELGPATPPVKASKFDALLALLSSKKRRSNCSTNSANSSDAGRKSSPKQKQAQSGVVYGLAL